MQLLHRLPPSALRTAPIPLAAWTVWTIAARPDWTVALLLLSPLVLAPLALRLVDPAGDEDAIGRIASLAPVLAAPAVASFALDPGSLAAALTVPWLLATCSVAALGALRFLSRRQLDAGIGFDAGMAFLAVGGTWLTISRLGANPLGFDDTIVLLTAVHFHYAGLILPIVTAGAARRLGQGAFVPASVVLGVPLTALGITVGGDLEWFAATVMAVAGLGTAALLAVLATRSSGAPRLALGIAGAALTVGMCLAIGWAWSVRFGWDLIDIDTMARTHGSLNALGFGAFALVGLHLLGPPTQRSAQHTLLHWGRRTTRSLEALVDEATDSCDPTPLEKPTPPRGFRRDSWQREVDEYERARSGLLSWAAHRSGGLTVAPADATVEPGSVVAYAIPLGPLTATAVCRVVRVVDGPDRAGFVYATCDHHHEEGVMSWMAERRPDGTAVVEVVGVWRPAVLGARIGPVTRWLQSRAIRRMLAGLEGTGRPEARTGGR